MNAAPIILFAYKRKEHIRRALQSLLRNTEAKCSELIVYCDGPRDSSEQTATDEVRRLVLETSGFAKVTARFRDRNLGLSRSIISGVGEVLKTHDRAIIVEDDLEVSPYFLRFINDSLTHYEGDDRVASVCGYFYPVKNRLPETFFLRGADCWGWATWRRGWHLFNENGQALLREIERSGQQHAFDLHGAYPYTQMLRDQIQGKNDSWAILWQASVFLAGKLTLYPGMSLVQNTGFDSSGEHCGQTSQFEVALNEAPVRVGGILVGDNATVEAALAQYFKSATAPPQALFSARVRGWIHRLMR